MTQPPVATELKKSSTFLAQGDFQERNAVANGVEKFGDGGVVIAVSETAFQVISTNATTAVIDGLPATEQKGQPLVKPATLKLVRYGDEPRNYTYKLVAFKWLKEDPSKQVELVLVKETTITPNSASQLKETVAVIKKESETAIATIYASKMDSRDEDSLYLKLYNFKVHVPVGDWASKLGAMIDRVSSITSGNKPTRLYELELGFLDAEEAQGWHKGVTEAITHMQAQDAQFMAIKKAGGPGTQMDKSTVNRLAATWGL